MAAKAYYVVHTVHNFEGSLPPPARLLREVRYPPEDIPGYVTSVMGLWEVKKNVSGFLSQSYWQSVFNGKEDYNILLYQQDPISGKTLAFALHETADLELSERAFGRLRNTIEPLVDDCEVVFTKELLGLIILPEPVDPSKLSLHLTNMMRLHPRAHSDWFRIIQSLTVAALRKDDEESVDALLEQDFVDVGVTDRSGNTLLHYANSIRSVRKTLRKASTSEKREKLLNGTNSQGMTALDVAVEHNQADIVKELLESGARFGNRPERRTLHLAAVNRTTQGIAAVIQQSDKLKVIGFDLKNAINSLDDDGFTPLMISVRQQHMDGCCVFLQAGADPDIKHRKTGCTAMHYAAELGNTVIVKALIAFDAKIDIKDNEGKTPLDMARMSSRCTKEAIEILVKTTELVAKAQTELSELERSGEHTSLFIPPDSIILLSMDGGGCRGLLTCQTLAAIQKRMTDLQPDCSPLQTYVDYIAGTSAGGLIGLCIASGTTLGGTRATIFKVAEEVFKHPPTFPAHVVDKTTKETFGSEQIFTADIPEWPRLIVTTVLADRNPPVLHLMCNYGEARNDQKPPHEWKLWEVGRATSAAPIYFPPHEEKFVDGGVMANNPTVDAMVEIFSQEEKAKLGLVVSIGTGVAPSAKVDNVGILVPNLQNALKSIPKLVQTFSGLSNLLQLFIAQSTRSDGQEVSRARMWCKSLNVPYFRFSPDVEKLVDLAENDKVVLTDLMYQGALYNLGIAKEIDAVARYLLSRPGRKAKNQSLSPYGNGISN